MTKAWLIFQIDNQNVYQIEYNGCVGQDTIDAYKTMIAQEYRVDESDVLVKFDDELVMTRISIVSSELKLKTREVLDTQEIRN